VAEVVCVRDDYRCVVCYKHALDGQLAHLIPQGKYGKAVIRRVLRKHGWPDTWWRRVMHSPMNMRLTCSLECNSAVSISNHPLEMEALVVEIVEKEIA
jgi:hypothetical protein